MPSDILFEFLNFWLSLFVRFTDFWWFFVPVLMMGIFALISRLFIGRYE